MSVSVWQRILLWSRQAFSSPADPVPEKSEPPDFELTKYGYDREHELELNKFTHALEVEQLKLLFLLNGGAAAALLTFAERVTYPMTREGLLWPVLFWIAGLTVAAGATFRTRLVQGLYSKAYRHRRHATEWRRTKRSDDPQWVNPLGLPESELLDELGRTLSVQERKAFESARDAGVGDFLYESAATFLRKRAERSKKWISALGGISIACFIAGAVTAAVVATAR